MSTSATNAKSSPPSALKAIMAISPSDSCAWMGLLLINKKDVIAKPKSNPY
jgi:hypothetical protein